MTAASTGGTSYSVTQVTNILHAGMSYDVQLPMIGLRDVSSGQDSHGTYR